MASHLRVCRRRQRERAREAEPFPHRPQLKVVRAEVVSPLGDAVCLVHRQQVDPRVAQPHCEPRVLEPLRRDVAVHRGADGDIIPFSKRFRDAELAVQTQFAVAEAYPQLQAAQNFLALQNELTDTEDKIQAARRFYNANVRDLSIAVQTFPSSLIAQMFSFKAPEFFETANQAEKEPVSVKF